MYKSMERERETFELGEYPRIKLHVEADTDGDAGPPATMC